MTRSSIRIYSALPLVVIALLARAFPTSAAETTYTITIHEDQPRVAAVEARLAPREDLLWMNDDGDQGLPHGWSTFVRGVEVLDSDGTPIAVTYEPLSRWRLARPASSGNPAPLTVRYEVLLQHDRFPLNFGDNGAAYARDGAVMWSGRTLFLAGQSAHDIGLELVLPEGWQATTPFDRVDGEPNRFTVASNDDLLNSALMLGSHVERTVSQGPLELRLALSGPRVTAAEGIFVDELGKYLQYYESTIGPAPRRNMIVIAADSTYWGGEVMGRAISLSVADEITGPNPMLAHLFAHEIVHLWGLDINFAQEDEEELYWFYEGMLAEYLSYLANVRLGDISEEDFLSQLSDHYQRYLAAAQPELSMSTAGRDKAAHYDLIYSGGMIAAAALDLAVRERSDNQKGVEDLIRALYSQYPRANGARSRPGVALLDSNSITRVAAEVLDPESGSRLRSWIDGSALIPFDTLAGAAGLRLVTGGPSEATQSGLTQAADPTSTQRSIYESIVRGR